MHLKDVKILIPADVIKNLKIPPEEAEKRLRLKLAASLYSKGIATLRITLKIAGVGIWEFLDFLEREGFRRHYDNEEALRDLGVMCEIKGSC